MLEVFNLGQQAAPTDGALLSICWTVLNQLRKAKSNSRAATCPHWHSGSSRKHRRGPPPSGSLGTPSQMSFVLRVWASTTASPCGFSAERVLCRKQSHQQCSPIIWSCQAVRLVWGSGAKRHDQGGIVGLLRVNAWIGQIESCTHGREDRR